MNRRKLQNCLDQHQCKALEHAWIQSANDGYPLNALITIHPGGECSPLDLLGQANAFWNRLGVWSRRSKSRGPRRAPEGSGASGPTFRCVLVREAAPNGKRPGINEHWHALVHVPPGRLASLKAAIARWYPDGVADIRAAHQGVTYTTYGKIKSAIGYLTKQRTPQARWNTAYRRQPGGLVLGKRFKITSNLRAKPITVALPRRSSARPSVDPGSQLAKPLKYQHLSHCENAVISMT